MQQTSLMAWNDIQPKLGFKQKQVLKLMQRHDYLSDQQIAHLMKMPINSITPRRNELEKKELIENCGKIRSNFTNKFVNIYQIVPVEE